MEQNVKARLDDVPKLSIIRYVPYSYENCFFLKQQLGVLTVLHAFFPRMLRV
jgi:hypothetical protein